MATSFVENISKHLIFHMTWVFFIESFKNVQCC